MTVQECFMAMGGDYEDALNRFGSDEKITRFLKLFLEDEHFNCLCEAMQAADYEEAFHNVHTLKGVCANLSLCELLEEAKKLTELLRGREGSVQAEEQFAQVKAAYSKTKEAIEEL